MALSFSSNRWSVSFLLILGGLFLCGFSGAVSAQSTGRYFSPLAQKTVGVPRWQPLGTEAEQQDWLSGALQAVSSKDLGGVGEINLVPLDQFRRELEEAGLATANPNQSGVARKIAQKTAAQILLIGTYQIKDRRIQLSGAFYDPTTQKTLAATSKLGHLGEIKSLETELVKDLLLKVDITLGATEREWLNRPKTLEAPDLQFEQVKPRPEVFRTDQPAGWLVGEDTDVRAIYRHSMFVGMHYPGASIGFRTAPRSTVEIRASQEFDITVIGGRYNYRFHDFGNSNLFFGLQASHIDFTGEASEGTGLLGGTFFGFERHFTSYTSFRTDFGGYLITLEDDATGVSVSGLGFALNTGVAVHFW